MRRFLGMVLMVLALPCIYLGGAGAVFYYQLHAVSGSVGLDRLPLVPAVDVHTRLLVVAPHCDDEMLGCGGLIQKTLHAGGQVRVAILTNGDGFRAATQRALRDLRVEPQDYIRFARLRQEESRRALAHLGVSPADVLFLGYPDRGLAALWHRHWTPDRPYTSPYTYRTCSPYPDTFHPKARYCGQELLTDLIRVVRQFRPNRIVVTHPQDDHPDHSAAAAFVSLALQVLRHNPSDGVRVDRTLLEHYLVHRGDWPLPQGRHEGHPLCPPPAMAHLDTRWAKLPLTAAETDRKMQGILLYPSQTLVAGRFLASFARQNELFGTLPSARVPLVSPRAIVVDGATQDWQTVPPALLHPVADNVMRDLDGGGDLRALYVCRDRYRLYLRCDMRQTVAGHVRFTVHARTFSRDGRSTPRGFTLLFSRADSLRSRADGVRVAVHGRTVEVSVPRVYVDLPPREGPGAWLSLAVSTDVAGVTLDQSGIRLLEL
ncbi:MAG: PIG-L family deacetylase [Chloroherpetonaceae bacterium]|nr:PIG-L family deacetylase [Chloroherpetonaceae bacterium]